MDTTTGDLVSAYDRSLRLVLDTHAPLKVRSIPCRKKVPWFSTDLAEAIHKHQKLERIWSKDPKSREKFLQFYYQWWLISNMWDQAERSFFWGALADNRTNLKEIFNICNTILGRNNNLPLSPSDSNITLANNFNNYFHDKIGNIYSSLVQQNQAIPETYGVEVHPCPMPPYFMEFKPISCSNLEWYVMASSTKSCELDPIPTSLLKKILPSVTQLLTAIVNNSTTLGIFPNCIKGALVQPLLKKANLDLVNKNYRLVSNLPFVGKLIECVVADQVTSHITNMASWKPTSQPITPITAPRPLFLRWKQTFSGPWITRRWYAWSYLIYWQLLILSTMTS